MKKFLIMVMVLVLTVSTIAFAAPSGYTEGLLPTPDTGNGKIGNIGNLVTGVLQTVAYVVAVGVLMFVGIKFMLASPAEKANIKGMMVPYIIGAVLIFGAGSIIGIIGGWSGHLN